MDARYVTPELTLHAAARRDDPALPPLSAARADMPVAIYDIAKLHAARCTVFEGKVYNGKGHPICGVLNQHDRPCHRIGRCPFHYYSSPVAADNVCNGNVDAQGTAVPDPATRLYHDDPAPTTPPKKMQYKHGWSKEEHYRFLYGLRIHGRGAWKQIALEVKTRTPTQVQSHAQKFFLRQKQRNKNKRSIHDLTLDSPEMADIEKQLAIDAPAIAFSVRDAAAHGNALPPEDFAIFAPTHFSAPPTDPRPQLGALQYKDERGSMPLTLREGMAAMGRAPALALPAVVASAPPTSLAWYAPLDKAPTPAAFDVSRNSVQPRTDTWPELPKAPVSCFDGKRDALLDAAQLRAPVTSPPDALPLLYSAAPGAYGAGSYDAANALAHEAPSTSVYLGADGVADMLSGVKGAAIAKPSHRATRIRAWPPARAKLIPDLAAAPSHHSFDAAPLAAAFLDLPEPTHPPPQTARDVGALLAGDNRWKRER